MNPMKPDELEQFIHRELRGLPARTAPSSLEGRVLAEIERRAAIAWYHKSWSYWPAPVRALFLAFTTAIAGAAISAVMLISQGIEPTLVAAQIGRQLGWIGDLVGIVAWGMKFITHQIAQLPRLWVYGTIATMIALYTTFLGLGATAYRVLARRHS